MARGDGIGVEGKVCWTVVVDRRAAWGGFFFGEIGSCGVVCCVVEGNRGERESKKERDLIR